MNYPGRFLTDVESWSGAKDIFRHNPYVTPVSRRTGRLIKMHCHGGSFGDKWYMGLNQIHEAPIHFLEMWCRHLGMELDLPNPCRVPHPLLYLSKEEKAETLIEPPYALINAGYKRDCKAKFFGHHQYQEVVDAFPQVRWVQIGEDNPKDHEHRPLSGNNVKFHVRKTNFRQLFQLASKATFGLGGITFLQHVFAAFEKPYVACMGGREQRWLTDYQTQISLSACGMMDCCRTRGCWLDSVGEPERKQRECVNPVQYGDETIAGCHTVIGSDTVIRAIHGLLGTNRRPLLLRQ